MGLFHDFPYTNFHEINLDQIIKIVQDMQEEWESTKNDWNSMQEFITNYFNNLDVSEEVLQALQTMVGSGELSTIIDPVIVNQTSAWLASHITPTTPAVDNTLSIAGAAADAKTAGMTIENLRENLQNTKETELFRYNAFNGKYNQGLYSNADGSYNSTRTDYVCTSNLIPIEEVNVIRLTDIPDNITDIYLVTYDADKNFIRFSGGSVSSMLRNGSIYFTSPSDFPREARYIGFSFKDANGISPANAKPISIYIEHIGNSTIETVKNSLINIGKYFINWQNYIYFWGQNFCNYSQTRIGIVEPLIITENSEITISDGYQMSIQSFNSTTIGTDSEIRSTGWTNETQEVKKGSIILINIRRADDSNITPSDGNAIKILPAINYKNYAIDSTFNKKGITLNQIGVLSYHQSFCIYNNKYYSTDGSHIAEQDSNFEELRNVSLELGHGNALQLGSNEKAYVSGWNDSKIYVVDLNTLTIDSTINLPTTGYTTAAIDDINKIAYIFQRDTDPTTINLYNFIIYNYEDNEIISTRKTTPFGAMQACDFIDGRIFVVNGLGNTTIPNGFRIYNTTGDVIGEYVITQLANEEPEGVCIDRNSKDVYISDVSKNIFKIS